MHSVVWFKKDLRLSDHAPLAWAAEQARLHSAAVLPVWVYEPQAWQQADASARHLGFANECLADLQTHIAHVPAAQLGGQSSAQLLRCHGDMLGVLTKLKAALGSFSLVSHEETGNGWSYARDKAVAAWCKANGVAWQQFPSNAVVRALHARGGGRDRWSAHWAARMKDAPLAAPLQVPWLLLPQAAAATPNATQATQATQTTQTTQALAQLQTMHCGELTAQQLGMQDTDAPQRQKGGRSHVEGDLFSFLGHRGQNYRFEMSSPLTGADSCSRLSPHLAWGTLSVKEAVHATWARRSQLMALPREQRPTGFLASLKSFESRLHWHCHFVQKLESESAIEFRNVHRGFDNLRNEGVLNPEEETKLIAWAEGKTGYPFVDACMRSLLATGWINFRMRAMLVSLDRKSVV